jgi:CRISPR-associated protein Cpf1
LNFENSTLLSGWDVNKETDNAAILFRKEGMYYLGVMDKQHNKIFKKAFPESKGGYEKIDYKLLPGANKMLPKVFFSKSRIEEFAPSNELMKNYKLDTHKKGKTFNIEHCHKLIDFFKSSLNKHDEWRNFSFKFSDTKNYKDLSGFYREVEQQGYSISFRSIPDDYINELVDTGKLYLFQIYNKDFSPYSKGTPNMHTLYWKMLFDERNLANVVYKLNGQAEIFYRKSSINKADTTVHKAHINIANKNSLNKKKESVFEYEIIKDRRFTMDKFQFHVPITMNFKAEGNTNINEKVNHYLVNNSSTHIIGIDRGERHLLYLVVIDLEGNIVEQFTLNDIINNYNGNEYKTDYHHLLDEREGSRASARKDWKTIENIKELKEGYLSQVIHKISQLMVKYNAIVVLEDLNFGFMRGRQKFEKQVYQKFEKMLIDKLNYLVDKKKDAQELGGTLNALQLTNKFDSFKKLGKQSGFLFYIPAWNTSKMDPVTGFVNMLDTRYSSVEKSRRFFNKFDNIAFNKADNSFNFSFDYNKFHARAEGTKTEWTVVANATTRYRYNRELNNGHGGQQAYNVAQELELLFGDYQISYGSGDNLIASICAQSEKRFFVRLLNLLATTISLRHNNGKQGKEEEDFILSPIADKDGVFFDSRIADNNLPKDADANGAYNIARKGLWVVEQIQNAEDLKKIKLAIKNKEWLRFAQGN